MAGGRRRGVDRVFATLAVVLLALAAAPALATPLFTVPWQTPVEEGDSGQTDVEVPWSLSAPSATEVSFTWQTLPGPRPIAGLDYVPVPPTQVTVPPGQTQGTVVVSVLGNTRLNHGGSIDLRFDQFNGMVGNYGDGSRVDARVRIVEDDERAPHVTLAYEDYAQVAMDGRALVDVADNDYIAEYGSELSIIQAPARGQVEFEAFWQEDGHRLGRYFYRPEPGFSGRDHFLYAVCGPSGVCSQARVRIDVKPRTALNVWRIDRSGYEVIGIENLPELAGVTYLTSPLVAPERLSMDLPPDHTPQDPWNADSELTWVTRTLSQAPDGRPIEYRIVLDATLTRERSSDAYVGVDLDGDGRPSRDEVRCRGYGDWGRVAFCETVVRVTSQPVVVWVAGHTRSQDLAALEVDLYIAPIGLSDGSLVASGPAQLAAGSPLRVTAAWQDATYVDGERRMGFVQVWTDADTPLDPIPLWLLGSNDRMGLPLFAGEPRTFGLAPGQTLDRIFIDVPEGATRLDVRSRSEPDLRFHLVRHPGNEDPSASLIAPAPTAGDEAVRSSGPAGEQHVRVEGADLSPGRWYVVPANPGGQRATIELQADVEAVAPVVRPGSYFNVARPGSGLVLYPAGGERVGLLYTYEAVTGRPTWYYLQAPQPGVDGIWHSAIYRQARHAEKSTPTPVGRATVTPMGLDTFSFTYTLQGETGSEIYSSLGRGCPSLSGSAVDISSHWFNPARAGSGYSIQAWAGYEFHAAYVYDEQGSPLWLAAEQDHFGGASDFLPLQRLAGACLTCEYAPPERQGAGILYRTIEDGLLSRIQLDVQFRESWPLSDALRTWSLIDRVELLGGPGSTQGCMP